VEPTVVRHGGFRLLFFEREERRMHVHVACADGEATFRLEPRVEVVANRGLTRLQLRSAEALIRVHGDTIRRAWQRRFDA
jgi:hypothetical protein